MFARQLQLLDRVPLAFDPLIRRISRQELGEGAWVDHAPAWLRGGQNLFDALERGIRWRQARRVMYEREVDVPRLIASLPDDGAGDPMLAEVGRVLGRRYGTRFNHVHLSLYRHGGDSVAWHGDRVGKLQPHATVAILSLGGPRRFLLRRRGGGQSRPYTLGSGDLLVMGGTCQTTWEHCVPKVARAEPRIAIMFRERY